MEGYNKKKVSESNMNPNSMNTFQKLKHSSLRRHKSKGRVEGNLCIYGNGANNNLGLN